ncbi:RHS repeat-associated core domain-containing protein [Actimicrobium sp. CCI2.3]|uniref:RHS repeat-associated core domain-containing protein n=1 Tax=Actimicrobium sp. CCI2.3 TaxID=3048616 RepID=UPI002AB5C82B|nr:RHS repeat-associated core domain-containing protein [Actimicrobium sp. CCI2.3]MDY7574612.1 RHS repeat-associated core domain-containing protein [Actimicrobium sp. CCI2.3]MEB0023889.1 RHS repeat-associated core domain-containing protein [Actimicrobium sp. CCI2.3]
MTSTFDFLRRLCFLLVISVMTALPAHAQSSLPQSKAQCTAPTAGNPGNACAGNPINLITGNKYQRDTDLAALPGVLGLEIVRHYNSVFGDPGVPNGLVGRGWRLSYEVELVAIGTTLQLIEADGHRIIFNRDPLNRSHCSTADPANGTIAILHTARGDEYAWQRSDGQVWRFNHQRKLDQITAPTGEFVSLIYDNAGLLMQVTDPQGRQLHLNYPDRKTARSGVRFNGVQSIDSPAGRFDYHYGSTLSAGAHSAPSVLLANLVRVRLPNQTERQYHYEDPQHPTLLTGISVSAGTTAFERIATFGYQADGKAILSTHAGDVDKVTLSYQPGGVTLLTNSLGQVTTYRHADIARENRLLEARGPGCALCNASDLRYGYDTRGREVTLTRLDASGNPVDTTLTERDDLGRPLTISKQHYQEGKAAPAQWQVRYEYAAGAGAGPTLIARPGVVAGKESQTRITYNAAGQPLTLTESGWSPATGDNGTPTPITRTTRYRYIRINGRSLLAEIDGPLANGPAGSPLDSDITQFHYDERGNFLIEIIAPGNQVTRVTARDTSGRPQKIATATGIALEYDYDLAGHFTRVTRAGISELFSYNALGQLSGAVRTTGQRLAMRYGADGRVTDLSDPQGNRIQLQRDTEGTLLARSLLNPDGSLAQKTNLSLLDVDADRKTGTLQTDTVHDLVFAVDNTVTRFQYEQDNRLARITDARQHQTGQLHDDFGRLVRVDSPDGGVTVLAYDAADRLISKSIGQGAVIRYRHDVAGRLIGQFTAEGDTRVIYGKQGRPVRITYPAGEEQFSYDQAARLISHVRLIDGQRITTGYVYDARGQLSKKILPDGQILHYRYHGAVHPKAGLLAAITREDLFGHTVLLDGLNDTGDGYANQHYQLANGVGYQRQLDQTGHITRIGSTGYWEENHQHNPGGQLTQRDATTTAGLQRTRYDYDAAGRMTAIAQGSSDRSFRYDPTGNLLTDRRDNVSTGYTVDPASNRLTAIEANGQRIRVDYNAAGSITRSGDTAYTWDSQQRLIRVSQRDQPLADYTYNAFGERIKKVSYSGNQKKVTYYFYDGSELVAEAQANAKDEGKRNPIGITRQYVWLVDQAGSRPIALLQARDSGLAALAGQTLASIPTATTRAIGQAGRTDVFALIADHTGAPRALVNERKQVVWRSSVAGFGELIPDANVLMTLNLRGSNQYYDAETNLHYNHHRYLDPHSGRYLSTDPSGIAGGLNLYAFAANNPVANIDPLGLQAKPAGDISDWDMQRRVQYVLLRAGGQIPGVIGDQLRELVSPASLATTAGIFTIWAGTQAIPIAGEIVDVGLVAAGYAISGTAGLIAIKDIVTAAFLTASAQCEADLQKAGDTLAGGLVNAMGAGVGLAGSTQALRTERVQGFLSQVLKESGASASASASASFKIFPANEIRFSQNSVSFNKKDRITGQVYSYDDLVASMKLNGWKGDPVDVVRMPDGKLTSMDNTRIAAAREAGIDVQAKVREFNEKLTPEMQNARGWNKYSSWGEAIVARINSQSKNFGVINPYGSLQLPNIKGKP